MPDADLCTFGSPFCHGYFRIAVCTPHVTVADPTANAQATAALIERAVEKHAGVAVFPELGLSAYSDDDLFFQDALLDDVERAIDFLCAETAGVRMIAVVGAPLRAEDKLFNCAVVLQAGKILCVVPKTYLPNYREFYEKRHFASARAARQSSIGIGGTHVPFGNDIVIESKGIPGLGLHVEICEDLWVPVPPSCFAAMAGATVLINLSASNVTIGKGDYRRRLAASQSGRSIAAYVYCAAGFGESTTDLAWDGQAMIHENGDLLVEGQRFANAPSLVVADVDLDRLRQDRMRTTSFYDCAEVHRAAVSAMRRVEIDLAPPRVAATLERTVERFPFVPSDPVRLAERCTEAYAIQVQGIAKRLEATGIEKVVIGVSGGVDSAQALIVAAEAFDLLKLPRSGILGFEMPGFATSPCSRENALALMAALGVTSAEIDIRPSASRMLSDIGHPYAKGQIVYDVTFENVQAGERTSHLFRLANLHRALVIGTSDLSELALGYTTYGVGDHMSHYAVNASVPKTLIRHLLAWSAQSAGPGQAVSAVLQKILETPPSPELVPGAHAGLTQQAEETVGPYALQDFFLYYLSRFGYRPSKVAYLAQHAWSDPARGVWPTTIPQAERTSYDLPTIKHWLEVFIRRFFGASQFKRSALPNGPKIGSGGSLSPRADWRAPSDNSVNAWLAELAANVP